MNQEEFKKTPIAICPQSKYRLNYLDLVLPFNCNCIKKTEKKSSKFIHLYKLYDKLDFNSDDCSSKKENNKQVDFYQKKSKAIIMKICNMFFHSENLISIFSKKSKIDEEPFLDEKKLELSIQKIEYLENNEYILKTVKALILDINIFMIILKKNPSFVVNEINLLKVLSSDDINSSKKFIEEFKEYIEKIKFVKSSFNDGYLYEMNYSRKIIYILPIISKNIILIILENYEFRIYNNNINDLIDNNNDNCICSINLYKQFENICHKISCLYNLDNKLILIMFNDFHLFFLEIVYDINNKPINMKLLNEEKYNSIFEIEEKIEGLSCIDEDKILFTCDKNVAQIFKKNDENEFFLYKSFDIKIKKSYQKSKNYCLYDKFNKQIIIYYNIYVYNNSNFYLNIYDSKDYEIKKIINFGMEGWFISLKILNKEFLILNFQKKIILISSKYLEIIRIYEFKFPISIFCVINNANLIILNNGYNYNALHIYKLFINEIKYIGNIPYNGRNIGGIKEINDKGDHIIVSINKIYFNYLGKKIVSRISYVNNRTIKNIKNDYSKLRTLITKYYVNLDWEDFIKDYNFNKGKNKYYDDFYCECNECQRFRSFGPEYFDPEDYYFYYECDCLECLWYKKKKESLEQNYFQKFNHIKEDRNIIKKKYKNKKKRKHINVRILKAKKKYNKYYSNKNNLTRYIREEYEDIFYVDNY